MDIQGYECKECGNSFEEIERADSESKIQCPSCGSTNAEQSDAASEFLELVRDMGRTGG